MIVPLNIRQYARLVEEMRRTQQEYRNTRTRQPDSLARSQELERIVDRTTARIVRKASP